jgi:protein phosphatase
MTKFATRSHMGRVYDHNEDSVRCRPELGLFLVADGMGGHASGEVASRVAADAVLEHSATMPLVEAIRMAHLAVVAAAEGDSRGMGSTMVAATVRNGRLDLAWVGDSRAYLYRSGELQRITRDHSLVNLLIDRKELTDAQAQHHPQKNVITQTLGHGDPTPSVNSVPLRARDRVLLCSDGLNDELTDADIAAVLGAHADLEAAVTALVEQALAKGGRDNISAVLIECEAVDAASWRTRFGGRRWRSAVIGISAAAALAVLAFVLESMGWI